MAGTIYSKFFWQDWAGDTALIRCSPGAQALWARLLCIAAEAEPVGHVLMTNGERPSVDDLVAITRFPAEHIPGWIEELQRYRVCDTTREGTLVSRRMLRDERKRRKNARGGHVSASVTPRNDKGNFTGRDDANRPVSPATINQSPSTINHQPKVPLPGMTENLRKVDMIGTAIGIDLATTKNGNRFIQEMVRLEMDGFDFDLDIMAAIVERMQSGSASREISSLNYFRKAIEAKKVARGIAAAAGERRAANVKKISPKDWGKMLSRFVHDGLWLHPTRDYQTFPQGPSPLEEGCQAPPDWLAVARKAWNEQGQRPKEPGPFVDRPTPFWGDNVVQIPRRTA